MRKRILVVDDSAVVRRFLVKLFEKNGYVADTAKDGAEALEKIRKTPYSLVTLDFEMPVKDGLSTLKEILCIRATRVLMLSAYTTGSADLTFKALELGAIDYIQKPKNAVEVAAISNEIIEKVKQVLLIPPKKINKNIIAFKTHQVDIDTDIDMNFVLIGASTGGPRLIEKICKTLPKNYPHAVCVVQHMPVDFTANFAKRLNSLSEVEVLEADNGIELKPAKVVIAKGGWHLHFRKKLKNYVVKLSPNTNDRFFVPSVDEMFFSASEILPAKKILAIELTGIGDDGAEGMVVLRKKGAYTIAESERSAIVYGMPKEAYEKGGAVKVSDFNEILDEIIKYGQKNRIKPS